MSATLEMPRERDGETPEDRTRRFMQERPEMVDHLAFWQFCEGTGRNRWIRETRDVFAALPEGEKNEWREKAWEACEAYWAMSPEERAVLNRESLRKTLADNDRRYAEICAWPKASA